MDNVRASFKEHRLPEFFLEECSYTTYAPSQSEQIAAKGNAVIVVVCEGKCVCSDAENRYALGKHSGILIRGNHTCRLRVDSNDSCAVTTIRFNGSSVKMMLDVLENNIHKPVFQFDGDLMIIDAVGDLVNECARKQLSPFGIQIAFYQFLNCLYDHYAEKKTPSKNTYLTRAVDYIKKNYNNSISVEEIADMLGIERSYLSRLFKTYKHKSTQNYIIDYRIHQAKRMFEEEDMNVSQVSAAVGYTNIYCFSRIFKSRVGMPPKEYMERCRKRGVN